MDMENHRSSCSYMDRVCWGFSNRTEFLMSVRVLLVMMMAGCSENSSSVTPAAPCETPTIESSNSILGLVAPPTDSADESGSSITLKWDPSSMVTGYHLYIGLRSNSYLQVADVGSLTTSMVSNLTGNTTYYFVVTAYNSAGESCASNEVSAHIP